VTQPLQRLLALIIVAAVAAQFFLAAAGAFRRDQLLGT
jgi:hypothetical protein